MSGTGETIMKYWPVLVVAGGLLITAGADNYRLTAHAEDIEDLSASVDENEDTIDEIQQLLIRRQGEVELDVQRIEGATRSIQIKQEEQGEDIDEILRLLQQIEGR